MDAFIQIIEQLVQAVAPSAWKESRHFPFPDLAEPKGSLFDACLFSVSAHGALGFAWIQFEGAAKVLVLPFRLSRNREEGDLIVLPPWSLRDATADGELFVAWRHSLHTRNPLLTARGGTFGHRYSLGGEPEILALAIWGDTNNTCVRIESQECYKIFRSIDPDTRESLEVEVLEYLAHQSNFLNYARIVSIFDYQNPKGKKSPSALSTRYIQNDGTLWHTFGSKVRKARFPENMQNRQGRESWEWLLNVAENLGRLMGDFHRAMTGPRERPLLVPESGTLDVRRRWLENAEKALEQRISEVISLKNRFPAHRYLFENLNGFTDDLLACVKRSENLGLLIRTHGHVHLGQVLIGTDGLYLLDFESDNIDSPEYALLKQPALKDVASLLLSMQYSWFSIERDDWSPIFSEFFSGDPETLNRARSRRRSADPDGYKPEFKTLSQIFMRFYRNAIREEAGAAELIPQEESDFQSLLNLCLLMRILKETMRDARTGHPRVKVGLKILHNFIKNRT